MMRLAAVVVCGLLLAVAGRADAADARRVRFGALRDGTQVDAVTLTNGGGMSVRLVAWGAMMQ